MPLALTTVFADLPDPRIETANKLEPLAELAWAEALKARL